MASPLMGGAPQCRSCVRRLASWGNFLSSPAAQHIRGKKKLARDVASIVNVQLLQNVPGYGRKGQVLPIPSGVMRNIWYPKGMAGYVTEAKLEALGDKATVERDPTFGTRKERESLKKVTKSQSLAKEKARERPKEAPKVRTKPPPAAPISVEAPIEPRPIVIEMLSPDEATGIMDDVLPSNIDFYRTPIAAQETPKRVSPSIPAGSALSRAAEAAAAERASKDAKLKTPVKVGIYGSISTIDIAANLKAVLAEHEQGARVVLSPENVKFVEATEEKDRVKHLGTFEIEINLNEASKGIRRKITVNAQG